MPRLVSLTLHAVIFVLFAVVALLAYAIEGAPINWLVVVGSGIAAVVANRLLCTD